MRNSMYAVLLMMSGTLSVVATPIGNMEDITLRAIRVLKEATVIFCEDTRVTGNLLKRHGIETKMQRLDAHTENVKIQEVITLLEEGAKIALVTDAGTPGISDPGSRVVHAVREAGLASVTIDAVPGPSALTALISISGFPMHEFTFLGFLPHKKGRQTAVKTLMTSSRATVVYESPHRIQKLLQAITAVEPNRTVCIGRELTKMYEEVLVGSAQELLAHRSILNPRGEFVVIISPQE